MRFHLASPLRHQAQRLFILCRMQAIYTGVWPICKMHHYTFMVKLKWKEFCIFGWKSAGNLYLMYLCTPDFAWAGALPGDRCCKPSVVDVIREHYKVEGGRRITFSRLSPEDGASAERLYTISDARSAVLWDECQQMKSDTTICYFTPNGRACSPLQFYVVGSTCLCNVLVPMVDHRTVRRVRELYDLTVGVPACDFRRSRRLQLSTAY